MLTHRVRQPMTRAMLRLLPDHLLPDVLQVILVEHLIHVVNQEADITARAVLAAVSLIRVLHVRAVVRLIVEAVQQLMIHTLPVVAVEAATVAHTLQEEVAVAEEADIPVEAVEVLVAVVEVDVLEEEDNRLNLLKKRHLHDD